MSFYNANALPFRRFSHVSVSLLLTRLHSFDQKCRKNSKILLQYKTAVFCVNILYNVIYSFDAKLNFQHHYSSLHNQLNCKTSPDSAESDEKNQLFYRLNWISWHWWSVFIKQIHYHSEVWVRYDFLMFLKVSSAHQGCIYLIKNTVNILKYYYNIKQLFSVWIYYIM